MRITLIVLTLVLGGLLAACNRSQPEPNRPPVAVEDVYRLEQGATLNVVPAEGLLANDSDPDGDAIRALVEDGPDFGEFNLNEDGSFRYRHSNERNAVDMFTYRITDGELSSETVTVTLEITLDETNVPPVARDQQVSVAIGTARDFTLVASDADGDDLSYTISREPEHGSWSGTVPDLRYTPEPGFSGADSLQFYVSDGQTQSNTATITFEVGGSNTPPTARSASVTVVSSTPRDIELRGTDADGNPLSFFIDEDDRPKHGTLTGDLSASENGTVIMTYTADPDYLGEDEFSFYVNDGIDDSETATVSITVVEENNPPTDLMLDGNTLEENAPVGTPIGTFSTVDADEGDSHRYELVEGAVDNAFFITEGNVLKSNVVFDFEVEAAYSIQVEVIDEKGGSFSRTFAIEIQDVNEAPRLEPQSFRVGESAANGDEVGSVFAFDEDAGQTLSYNITGGNTDEAFRIDAASGVLRVNNSAALSGVERFELQVEVQDDAPTPLSADATMTISVSEAGTPEPSDDNYDAIGNVPITFGAPGLLANDSDPEGAGLSVVAFDSSSANGGDVLVETDGAFSYTPPAGFQGSDSFSYTVGNGAQQATATVNVSVDGLIWFIDNTASSGDGRQSSPFNSLGDFSAINNSAQAGTAIFIYEGSGAYMGGLRLQDGQLLIGEGATSSVASLTGLSVPPGSDLPATGSTAARPSLTSSSQGLTLADGNLIAGISIENTGREAITGSGVTSLTLLDTSLSDCGDGGTALASSEECLELIGVSGDVLLRNVDITRPAGRGAFVQNSSGELALRLEDSSIVDNQLADVDALEIVLAGDASAVITIRDSSFIDPQTNGLQILTSSTAEAAVTLNAVTVRKTVAPKASGADPYYGIDLTARGDSFITFDLNDNELIRNDFDNAIHIVSFDQSTVEGFIRNNQDIRSDGSNRAASSIYGFVNGDSRMVIELSDNNISNLNATVPTTSLLNSGVFLAARYRPAGDVGGRLEATLENNTISVARDYDIELLATDNNSLCAAVSTTSASANGLAAFRARQMGAAALLLEGYSSSVSDTWNSRGNTPAGSVSSSGSASAGTCDQP